MTTPSCLMMTTLQASNWTTLPLLRKETMLLLTEASPRFSSVICLDPQTPWLLLLCCQSSHQVHRLPTPQEE
jgi:hypothetical protein